MGLSNHRIQVTSIGDHLLAAADRFPARPLLIFPNHTHTYASFVTAAYGHARCLLGLGIRNGDAVGILMANCPEYLELLVACDLIGAVAVPMNARYKSVELAYVVENADLKLLVTSDLIAQYANFGALLSQAFEQIDSCEDGQQLNLAAAPALNHVVMLGQSAPSGFLSQQGFTDAAVGINDEDVDRARVMVQVERPAIMMYTSGTTANPKGCPLSHGLLVRNAINMNKERYFLDQYDVFWAPLPMFHMSSILPFLCCIDAGAAMCSMTHVEAGASLVMLEQYEVTVAFPAFPTITNELISHPKFAQTNLSKLRRINNVAPVEMLRRFQEAFPNAIQTGAYGLTEAGGVIAYNHPDEHLEERLTTCGIPFPGIEVRICDPESMDELVAGNPGEMWIRGYCVFDGYHKSPEQNQTSFHAGWFRTGDLCSLTDNGSIRYHGRIKDMLKVGGENVAALEIESYLAKHPAVQLAQIIGRDDPRLQEVPVAFVELKSGAQASATELIEFCQGRLASFKVPRAVHFVTSWPMSSTKIQKFRLVEPSV